MASEALREGGLGVWLTTLGATSLMSARLWPDGAGFIW
ncbi:hypothetical protein DDI_0601 [Dickeya dianthicola RNS04.9]|nr:hypothetical protein DDI_0601 [Dickeya dianthicola RNS04.9]